jgi:signal transduction histidine kinase
MLAQILVAILVISVAFVVATDLARTDSEGQLGQPDRSGYETRPWTTDDTHGDRVGTSFRDVHGAGIPPDGYDVGAGRRSSPTDAAANFRSSRPDALVGQSPSTSRDMVPSEQGKRHVRTRLGWLVTIPAVAVAAIALCIVGLVYALNGTRISSSNSSVRNEAILLAVAIGIVMIVVVMLAARATMATARSVLRPLYTVRAQARALAAGSPSNAAPAEVVSPDEIGDIARALEQVRNNMSPLGGDEAGLRSKLDAMFVNLSQRGQSLAERQMRLIEHLEQMERDRERRATLFRMNQIAAHMYRNSQNLLVLAGHELYSGPNQPMALVNVIRAAVAEVEENERVSVYAQPELEVFGPAVYDVVHLLAELIQNATSFSAVDMSVEISGQLLNSGGVLISITDRGVGMSLQEIAHANWRLENPPSADIDVPKWIGLLVVARLAARHGVRVRLQPAEFGGVTALVWFPDEIIGRPGAVVQQGLVDSGGARPRRGAHEVTADLGYPARQRSMVMPRSAEQASAGEEVASVPLGRRLMPGEGPTPGAAWSAAGAQSVLPVDSGPAAAGGPSKAGPHGTLGGQAAGGQALASTQKASPGTAAAVHVGQDRQPLLDPLVPGESETSQFASTPPSTATLRQEPGSGDSGVIVPSAGNPVEERRLPIFDAVESNWFRAGRRMSGTARAVATPYRWTSPADEGWRAAETVEAPAVGTPTSAGLPRRTPNANLVPGTISQTQSAVAPARSAAEARDRLGGFQRGIVEGRTAASNSENPGSES